MENFLSLFVCMVLEFKNFPKRNLSEKNAYIGMMVVGVLLNFIYLLLWSSLLIYLFFGFFKIGKNNIIAFMKLDLNSKY